MGRKIGTFIVIFVLVMALGVLGYMIYTIMGNKSDQTAVETNPEPIVIKPEIILSKSEVEDNKVTISVHATTEDEAGLQQFILPDKTTVAINGGVYDQDYIAEENGDYEFTVVAANGEQSIAKTKVEDIEIKKPYVPAGFNVLNDSVETGFVIADEAGNQYVWVPVENGKISRTTMLDTQYEESSSTASDLVNSVAKYYGFYIARVEATEVEVNGEKVAASIPGRIPWTNINCMDAIKYANNSAAAFGYEDCRTALNNSYAWDSTLKWIDSNPQYQNYSSNVNYGNYSGEIKSTGTTDTDIIYYICDLAGNVSEWTTEICKKDNDNSDDESMSILRVIRGGSASLSRTPASRIGYPESKADQFWGFRLVLYK